jgi:hypothetical protein
MQGPAPAPASGTLRAGLALAATTLFLHSTGAAAAAGAAGTASTAAAPAGTTSQKGEIIFIIMMRHF